MFYAKSGEYGTYLSYPHMYFVGPHIYLVAPIHR
jgi:hypothetical protein